MFHAGAVRQNFSTICRSLTFKIFDIIEPLKFLGLATLRYRHHCLAALPSDKILLIAHSVSHRSNETQNVQALFDAALRQQLQGSPCAGAAQRALSRDRDRHSARREPHAGLSRQESERTGAALGSRGATLPRRIQRHPLVCRRRHPAGAGIADRTRRSAAVDVLRTARAGTEYRRGLFLVVAG